MKERETIEIPIQKVEDIIFEKDTEFSFSESYLVETSGGFAETEYVFKRNSDGKFFKTFYSLFNILTWFQACGTCILTEVFETKKEVSVYV